MSFTLNVNGVDRVVEGYDPETPLLWVLRDSLGLTGTKFGCGIAECGVCTVHVDGQAVKSCNISAASAAGKKVRTIEGLSDNNDHPVQMAWKQLTVPQCGYCQSGQIMQAAALLERNPTPNDREIDGAMGEVLCRCGTYKSIRAAIHSAAEIRRT